MKLMIGHVLFLVVLILLIDQLNAIDAKYNSKISVIRGGEKSNKHKKVGFQQSQSKKPKHKRLEDDEDEDENETSKISSKKKNLYTKGASKGKRLQVVVSNKKRKSSKKGGFQLPTISINLKDKLDDIAKQSQSVYKDFYRRAKVMRSSPFEGMLLKATWPGNEPIAPELLNEIIRHSIPAFKYGSSSNAEDDPYHMTLHKLWTKMCEKDWRVVVKSTFILHCISRDSSYDTCEKFASAIKSMSKIRNPKRPDHKYFNIRTMTALDSVSQAYQAFISSYARFVLFRAKTFIGRFDDVKQLPEDAKLKVVVAKLLKIKQCISYGLECKALRKDHLKQVIGQSVKSIALDLRDMWKIYTSKMPQLLLNGNDTEVSSNDHQLKKEIAELLVFYKESEGPIKAYLSSAAKSFSKLKIKIPVDLDEGEIDVDNINEKLAKLQAITGGASARSTRVVSKSIDDDEDDEEQWDFDAVDDEDDEDADSGPDDKGDEDEDDGDNIGEEDDDSTESVAEEEDENDDDDDDDSDSPVANEDNEEDDQAKDHDDTNGDDNTDGDDDDDDE